MLTIIVRVEKMAAICRRFSSLGMLEGTTAWYTAMQMSGGVADERIEELNDNVEDESDDIEEQDWRMEDVGPLSGPRMAPSVRLSQTRERVSSYPRALQELATVLGEPQLVDATLQYIYAHRHPQAPIPSPITSHMSFTSKVFVHHSAVARFFAPSDACGSGGMQHETIRCNRAWKGGSRMDTVLVSESDELGMYGMIVARLKLLFAFFDPFDGKHHECALVLWFPTQDDELDSLTGMWRVGPEEVDGAAPLQVISLSTVVRGVHLLPVYGEGHLPENFSYTTALDQFERYYVDSFIDHHTHELLVV